MSGLPRMIMLDEYQQRAAGFAVFPKRTLMEDVSYCTMGLTEEAGEVAGKVKKAIRDGKSVDQIRDDLKKELGDVLWYLAMYAEVLGLSLRDVAQENLTKLQDRKDRNVIHGAGDNR
jgi:NTP pyrophosphatase (non-canonical NTP hydrolase)